MGWEALKPCTEEATSMNDAPTRLPPPPEAGPRRECFVTEGSLPEQEDARGSSHDARAAKNADRQALLAECIEGDRAHQGGSPCPGEPSRSCGHLARHPVVLLASPAADKGADSRRRFVPVAGQVHEFLPNHL